MTDLLTLKELSRNYILGNEEVPILKKINLTVQSGEFIAIMGASGSGKSTLMNILGCLDKATSGSYQINGKEVSSLNSDELATLRREYFGFIFQRYHLLGHLTAAENVAMPAVYSGMADQKRLDRSKLLLSRIGLANRLDHFPNQLSGGQQQRVSIARALMNGGQVILADEPTGALDSKSSIEILTLLHELHQQGHTIILVTHDINVASHANRIIRISDGQIVADENKMVEVTTDKVFDSVKTNVFDWKKRFWEAFKMAKTAILAHKMRSLLTMLGIIIGITAVVSVVALGQGAQDKIISDINSIGTNVIWVLPGKDWGDKDARKIKTLIQADVDALGIQTYVDSVTPFIIKSNQYLQYKNISIKGNIKGVGHQFFRVGGYEIETGRHFTQQEGIECRTLVVIDHNTQKQFFSSSKEAMGKTIFLGGLPCQIIGITKEKEIEFGNANELNVWIPYQTAMVKLLGQRHFTGITVRVRDGVSSQIAESNLIRLLTLRHGNYKDFYTRSSDSVVKTVQKTTFTMKLLITAIAIISLLVGGIGVMNIMLVSVVERTHEIGIRMAVGARQTDIRQQFLIEAVLICLAGGLLGIIFSFLMGGIFSLFVHSMKMVFSFWVIILAVACSSMIGILFGFIPARDAARLNPVDALARE